jgi:hypothetical protein
VETTAIIVALIGSVPATIAAIAALRGSKTAKKTHEEIVSPNGIRAGLMLHDLHVMHANPEKHPPVANRARRAQAR